MATEKMEETKFEEPVQPEKTLTDLAGAAPYSPISEQENEEPSAQCSSTEKNQEKPLMEVASDDEQLITIDKTALKGEEGEEDGEEPLIPLSNSESNIKYSIESILNGQHVATELNTDELMVSEHVSEETEKKEENTNAKPDLPDEGGKAKESSSSSSEGETKCEDAETKVEIGESLLEETIGEEVVLGQENQEVESSEENIEAPKETESTQDSSDFKTPATTDNSLLDSDESDKAEADEICSQIETSTKESIPELNNENPASGGTADINNFADTTKEIVENGDLDISDEPSNIKENDEDMQEMDDIVPNGSAETRAESTCHQKCFVYLRPLSLSNFQFTNSSSRTESEFSWGLAKCAVCLSRLPNHLLPDGDNRSVQLKFSFIGEPPNKEKRAAVKRGSGGSVPEAKREKPSPAKKSTSRKKEAPIATKKEKGAKASTPFAKRHSTRIRTPSTRQAFYD